MRSGGNQLRAKYVGTAQLDYKGGQRQLHSETSQKYGRCTSGIKTARLQYLYY